MSAQKTTSPAPAGAAACPDTAPAGTLEGLALLLADLCTDVDALRELLADAEPTALHVVLADALAVLSWRCDFGRKLAGHAGASLSTAEELFIRPAVLRCVGGAA